MKCQEQIDGRRIEQKSRKRQGGRGWAGANLAMPGHGQLCLFIELVHGIDDPAGAALVLGRPRQPRHASSSSGFASLFSSFYCFLSLFLEFLGITRWHNCRLYITAASTLRIRRMCRHYGEKKATNPCEKRGSRAKCNGSVKRARRWHLLCGPAIIRCPFGQIGESDGEEQE